MGVDNEELCFVCNRGVLGNGVILSMETTVQSKTTFPTMLMQILGDAFMVVISESDKICIRCVKLINHTDKLKQDLKKTQSIIRRFLNEKYDLNEGIDFHSSGEDNQLPRYLNIHEEECLIGSSSSNVKYTYEAYKPKIKKELIIKSGSSENNYDVEIKSEPVYNLDQSLSISKNQNTSFSWENKNSSLLQKLPVFYESIKKNLTDLPTSQSGCDKQFKVPQDNHDFKESKIEKLPLDIRENNIKPLTPQGYNKIICTTPGVGSDEKSASIIHDFNSQTDKKKPVIESLCNPSDFVEGPRTFVKTNECNTEISNLVSSEVKTETPNIAPNKKPQREIKVEAFLSKSLKQNNNKTLRKQRKKNLVRKLRPILPKVSSTNDVLPSLYIIPHAAISVGNQMLQGTSISSKSNETGNSDATNFIQIQIPDCGVEPSLNINQCILNKVNQLDNEFGILSADNLTLDSNTDVIALKTSNHEKKQLKDRYQCSSCPKSFKRKRSLREHEVNHTGNYTHYCEFCGQGFSRLSKLDQHRKMHTKEASYVCDVCGKKFHFHGTYWIHRKWHDNPFPYKCDDCGKPFKHTSRLAVHRRKHTGERPYKCSYCPLTFNMSQTLKRHLFLHTKQFPYKCVMCDYGFTTRDIYTKHMARKHDVYLEKPSLDPKDYKVAICNTTTENAGLVIADCEKTIDFSESDCNIQYEKSSVVFDENPSDSHIEIIFPPEMPNDDFSDYWLT